MKKFLAKSSLALGSMLLCAMPALPSTISLNLGGINLKAGITTTGDSGTVTKFGETYSGNGTNFTESNLILTDTSNTWVLSGTLDGVTSSDLLTFTNTPTVNGTNTVATYGASTSLTVINSALATALGISSTGDSAGLVGSLNFSAGSATTVNGISYADSVTSPSLILSITGNALPTPEPTTFLLFGSGLLVAGLVSKARRPVIK